MGPCPLKKKWYALLFPPFLTTGEWTQWGAILELQMGEASWNWESSEPEEPTLWPTPYFWLSCERDTNSHPTKATLMLSLVFSMLRCCDHVSSFLPYSPFFRNLLKIPSGKASFWQQTRKDRKALPSSSVITAPRRVRGWCLPASHFRRSTVVHQISRL